ncbi:MBL fold metallo-hydrolase [Pedobacter faecalis]|uniref:MBL fold metallo-hydrolase n=1 Tax=Pedobacter faecalis TaxID=3041495 RepID=UPI00254D7D8C|nr:exonuclease [Pedobacter sp. ELA7]
MILEDFICLDNTGLYCRYGDFYIDPKQAVKQAIVSHAHGDHAVGGNAVVYCTEATSLFMKHRYKNFSAGTFHIKEYHQQFVLNDVNVTFIPAGHMLGSAMILMEYKGVRYLYTGDYKLQSDETCEPIEYVKADVLITETTFANPEVVHPEAELEILKLSSTVHNIMLGAYALGKSQRLISLINRYCTEKRILVHHSIMPYINIYRQMGVNLGRYEIYDRKVMKAEKTNLIYLVPPMAFNSYIRAVGVKRVFASGWKHLQRTNDMDLYISDHVDWNGIINTVAYVQPKQIWTNHGNGMLLKDYYQKSLVVKLLN